MCLAHLPAPAAWWQRHPGQARIVKYPVASLVPCIVTPTPDQNARTIDIARAQGTGPLLETITSLPFLKKYPQVCAAGAAVASAVQAPKINTPAATAIVRRRPGRNRIPRRPSRAQCASDPTGRAFRHSWFERPPTGARPGVDGRPRVASFPPRYAPARTHGSGRVRTPDARSAYAVLEPRLTRHGSASPFPADRWSPAQGGFGGRPRRRAHSAGCRSRRSHRHDRCGQPCPGRPSCRTPGRWRHGGRSARTVRRRRRCRGRS